MAICRRLPNSKDAMMVTDFFSPKPSVVITGHALNNTPTIDQINELFGNGEITGFKCREYGQIVTRRLFKPANGALCVFKKGSSRWGYALRPDHIDDFIAFVHPKPIDRQEENYKLVAKYRRYAGKASFTNNFIRACLAVPATKEEWIAQGAKSAYKFDLSTGTAIDGKIISLNAIAKIEPHYIRLFKNALTEKRPYSSGRFDFRGYEASISLELRDNGDLCGYLNVEYKGCANGYYYLLVNDDNFIGYDID